MKEENVFLRRNKGNIELMNLFNLEIFIYY